MALIAGIVALSLVLPAGGQSGWERERQREMARMHAEATAQLKRAERLWKDAGIDSYEFKVRFTCGLCPPEPPPGRPPFEVRAGKSSFKGNLTDDESVFVVENFIVATQVDGASANEEILQLLREIAAPRRHAVTVEEARPQNLLSTRVRVLGRDGVVLLANALGSNEVSVRRNAVIELHFLASGIGPSGRVAKVDISAARGALVRSMKDPDHYVQVWSLDALSAAGLPREIMPQVIEMLGDEEAGVRLSACAAMASYGVAAKASLPDIESLLTDSSPDVRNCAKFAIEKISGKNRAN